MNGARMVPQKRKVKQYGLNSTKDVRARLIEILMQRVMFHKDKFISPIIYDEMRAMEIKKSGKVEHSDKTHDDQVFSYLMALYVWYDGKNLVENFGLRKTTLKTDANDDYEIDEFEDAIEKKEKLDFNVIDKDLDSPEQQQLMQDIEWVMSTRNMTNENLLDQQRQELRDTYNKLLYTDSKLRQQLYDRTEQGIILDPVDTGITLAQTKLPDNLFMSYDLDDYDDNGQPLVSSNGTPLAGNLSAFYDSL